mgnify:CR=1 FL=1
MKKRRILALFVCLCLLLPIFSGCGIVKTPEDGVTVTKPTRPDIGDGVYNVGSEPLPYTPEELYQQLFDANNKVTVNLDMSSGELQKMQDDYRAYRDKGSKSPIYRKTDVVITITTATETSTYRIPEVGIRMKGNTSRTSFYDAAKGIYKYIHFRLDFGETFDNEAYYGSEVNVWQTENALQERKDRTFATLEKLELRWNKCYDSTYLKEIYAYDLYRSEGVLAPRANLSSLDWAGVHMGIYVMVEPIDDVFIQRNLPEADWDGDLYKCGWTNQPANMTSMGSIGIEDEDSGKFYVYDLKTNKKSSTHTALRNLITRLNSPSLTKDEMAKLVDLNSFISYAAVSYFLGNPDDMRNNYNNYYLYFVPSTGKAIVIPYDFDRCLGLTFEWNPTGNGGTKDDPFSDRTSSNDQQRSPLFTKSVVKGGFYVKEYSDALKKVAANPMLKIATFESWFNRANKTYGSLVQPSRKFYNADGRDFKFSLGDNIAGNISVNRYLTEKMNTYNRAMGNLDNILDYERPEQVVYYIRGQFNNWSDQSQYAMTIKDGKATITLNIPSGDDRARRFKVYNCITQMWYQDVSEESTANYSYLGDHRNIVLPQGRYKIVFDIETELITITPA